MEEGPSNLLELKVNGFLDGLLVEIVNPDCGANRCKPHREPLESLEHVLASCIRMQANRMSSFNVVLLVACASIDHEGVLAAYGHDVDLALCKLGE